MEEEKEKKIEKKIEEVNSQSSILDKIIYSQHKNALQEFEPARVLRAVLKNLKEREREVIIKRFALENDKSKTLEGIGKEYGVSRERIRQIEKSAINKIKEPTGKKDLKEAIDLIIDNIKEAGGATTEENIIEKNLNSIKQTKENTNALKFILEIEEKITKIKDDDIKKSWSLLHNPQKIIKSTIKEYKKILEKNRKTLTTEEITSQFKNKDFYKKNQFILNDDLLSSCLEMSKEIMKTYKGKWGLSSWPHVNPKNIKEKSLYIIRKYKKPAHFRDIAKMIIEEKFDNKKVNNQAVHNELVKDKNFVLIGRGIYGLAEWGLKPGTVADVIEEIFKKEGKPMEKNEIVKKVLEIRQVNPNTIILNLQEKPQFARVKKCTYGLKNANKKENSKEEDKKN